MRIHAGRVLPTSLCHAEFGSLVEFVLGNGAIKTVMPKLRIRLEVATQRGREHLKTIEAANLPRVGEKLETGERQTFEVVEVVHTPLIRDWDAVVIVKAVAMICVLPFLAA